jgi:hypothetical protein
MRAQDHSDERTDIRRTDQHYSWRGVYALCDVEADTHSRDAPDSTSTQAAATPPEDETNQQVIS